ncbi:MAG: hypothetical protein IJP04_07910 [Clostridia bacterium]|nr:hypothetical protein [Clostridia bacterium]
MAISKVVYGGQTLIDLTADTIIPEKVLVGYQGHGADGEPFDGTCDFDMNTQDANAADSEILAGKKAGVKGAMKTGTMKNNGAVALKITTKAQKVNVAQGYHDGSGTAEIDANEQAKIIADNIREGVSILGVTGTMSGSEDVKAQSKTATPSTEQQVILPDTGYTHLAQVTIGAIPYVESDNSSGGKTVTIG